MRTQYTELLLVKEVVEMAQNTLLSINNLPMRFYQPLIFWVISYVALTVSSYWGVIECLKGVVIDAKAYQCNRPYLLPAALPGWYDPDSQSHGGRIRP